jgi:hypothetical protein
MLPDLSGRPPHAATALHISVVYSQSGQGGDGAPRLGQRPAQGVEAQVPAGRQSSGGTPTSVRATHATVGSCALLCAHLWRALCCGLSLAPDLGAQQTPGRHMTCVGITAACKALAPHTGKAEQQSNKATEQQSNSCGRMLSNIPIQPGNTSQL